MYLKKSFNRKTGRTQLFIVEAYRDDYKRPKTKVVKTLGYLDVLKKEYADPIAHFTRVAHEMTQERKKNINQIQLELNPTAVLPKGTVPARNFGYAAVCKILDELHSLEKIEKEDTLSKADYSLFSLFTAAICTNVLCYGSSADPQTMLPMVADISSLTMSDLYRAADRLSRYRNDILHDSYLIVSRKMRHSEKSSFYCYFTEYDLQPDKYSLYTFDSLFPTEHDASIFFSLFADEEDFPITHYFTQSSLSDSKTAVLLGESLKIPAVKNQRIVFLSGSIRRNYSDMARHIIPEGNGYIFCSALRYADEDLKSFCLSPDTKYYRFSELETITLPKSENRTYHSFYDDFKNSNLQCASRITEKQIITENGTVFSCKEKQIIIYSPSFAAAAKSARKKLIETAEDIVRNPADYTKEAAYAAGKYISGLHFQKSTGKISESCYSRLKLNQSLIDEESCTDGYIVIATSETGMSIPEIGIRCLKLIEISDYFQIRKAPYSQPSDIADTDFLQYHFLLNHICLIISRILEKKLDYRYTIRQISESLAKCEYINVEKDIYMLKYRDEVLDAIGEALGIDFSRRYRRLNELIRPF